MISRPLAEKKNISTRSPLPQTTDAPHRFPQQNRQRMAALWRHPSTAAASNRLSKK